MIQWNTILSLVIACTALFSFAATSTPDANADVNAIQASETACTNSAFSTAAIQSCISEGLDKSEALLNKVYGGMVQSMQSSTDANDVETLKRIVASEKAWVTFKEANCSYKGTTMLGGSGESLIVMGCHFDMTQARIKELRSVENGD